MSYGKYYWGACFRILSGFTKRFTIGSVAVKHSTSHDIQNRFAYLLESGPGSILVHHSYTPQIALILLFALLIKW